MEKLITPIKIRNKINDKISSVLVSVNHNCAKLHCMTVGTIPHKAMNNCINSQLGKLEMLTDLLNEIHEFNPNSGMYNSDNFAMGKVFTPAGEEYFLLQPDLF